MRIGILGGSFNPVHSGHVKLAQEARNQLNLDKVIFVPSFLTPLKSENLLWSAKKRVRLLQKALVKESAFEISLCEIKRGGVSYTVDTLKYFKSQVSPKDVLYFITGADTSASFHRWKSFDKILKLCHFVVASRPGYSVQCLPRGVIYMPMDAEDISSTLIRRRLSSTPKIK